MRDASYITVCRTSSACSSSLSGSTSLTSTSSLNSTLVCNTQSTTYSSSQMSCNVITPLLQSLFPGNSQLTIQRTLDGSLSPKENVTSFGGNGTVFAQLWFNGVEQVNFGCVQRMRDDFDSDENVIILVLLQSRYLQSNGIQHIGIHYWQLIPLDLPKPRLHLHPQHHVLHWYHVYSWNNQPS